jgi:hypothetical protein
VHFDRIENINWKDVTPRLGAVYDVFGNGKTAFKVTLNKYLLGYGTAGFFENGLSSNPNPINSLVTSTAIGWNDANHDFIPQCNLLNAAANGECSGWQSPGFGSVVPNATYDPNLLTGWGKRNFNWEFSAGVQHEVLPRVSLDVSYFRRWYGNFQMTDDLAVGPSDYDRFTFAVPADSRLPNSGGTLTAVDLKFPQSVSPQNLFVTLAGDREVKITDHWNGVDVTMNARLENGLRVQGGISAGRERIDNCDLLTQYPENAHQFLGTPTRLPFFAATPLEYCDSGPPGQNLATGGFTTQAKAIGAYVFPKIDVQVSGTFQSIPGQIVEADYNSFSVGTLGRPFGSSVIVPFRSFQIAEPGDVRMDRINQFDLRVSKILRFRTTRTNVNFDLYNVFNSNAITAENFAYDAWRQPQYVIPARFFKLSAQFDF